MSLEFTSGEKVPTGVVGSTSVSQAGRTQSIQQKVSFWRTRSWAHSTSRLHSHRKARTSSLLAIRQVTPLSSRSLKLQVILTSSFQLSNWKSSREKRSSEEITLSFWEPYFFVYKKQCKRRGRKLVCSKGLAWAKQHTKNDWWPLTPHQVTSKSSGNILQAGCETGPISACLCTRAPCKGHQNVAGWDW